MKIIRQFGSLAFVLGLFTTIFVGVPWHIIESKTPVIPLWLQIAIFATMGGILIVLLTVALEQLCMKKKASKISDSATISGENNVLPDKPEEFLLSTSNTISGVNPAKVLGLVQGHTVYAIWVGKDLSAVIRLILGGELTEYTDMMGKARAMATNRMIEQAKLMGADAIINVRYMTTSVIGSAAELLVYGTAVKFSE